MRYPPYISVRSRPSERISVLTMLPPTLVEPPSETRALFAAALSEPISMPRRSRSLRLPASGAPLERVRYATAIASLRVEAAGNVARAFHAAAWPVARFST